MTTLSRIQESPAPLALNDSNPIAPLLEKAMDKGLSPEVMQGYFQLYKEMEAEHAKKAFVSAFVKLQSELSAVVATKPVKNNRGATMYVFAPYDEIMAHVQKHLKENKFSVSFTTKEIEGDKVVAICTLMHISGHSQSNEYSVRIGSGPPNSTQTQADGAAHTYARRGALCNALNIVIDKDTDARAEGGYITPEQAREIEALVNATNSNTPKFWSFAQADAYATIREHKYSELIDLLHKKEQAQHGSV